ncbi:hypothetical protein EYF80_016833 [Liparis tanakae]|uniref:Uncharacterized protein n=1 Tax=Liparis tanakae TaxID=230148 RepID=A0A4Z2I6G0_9TELE|nr:hypothetical protein EYF80_016833 [Liparis tanakae]
MQDDIIITVDSPQRGLRRWALAVLLSCTARPAAEALLRGEAGTRNVNYWECTVEVSRYVCRSDRGGFASEVADANVLSHRKVVNFTVNDAVQLYLSQKTQTALL